jgi:N-carbamoylputrescine amidase
MRLVKVAATQMACSKSPKDNIAKAEHLVAAAAKEGAKIILIQELFEHQYFCKKLDTKMSDFGTAAEENKAVAHFSKVAKKLGVVLPVPFCERASQVYFNSVAIIDADGRILGVYRKTHLPDGIGYYEKNYFTPGNYGLKVWKTSYARIGVAICWDQWFSEAARCMALAGAEILFYPTAIGSEPDNPDLDSKDHWQLVMRGHSAANMTPVVCSNRIGQESYQDVDMTFYGSSFVTDEKGAMLVELDRESQGFAVAELDLDLMEENRRSWGIFRDRRPELYALIGTVDGQM